ncbi:helix-turn-helix domain-containing protein [Microvirga sp. CF3016]|uniref:helix-turn-helix domain-containing protein n=1 Tax=Microvirga sp. CF3016 TaxID=3110181 RepID=UPI002E782564|nr:helix-turn-helix domain-containing protein [Microvirga sp. CF3016]MEE1611114.1 helix-turn-helix domain-containing protein [Microvirga sp. CF3016]
MKPAALLNADPILDIDEFTKAPAPSATAGRARARKPSAKPAPFKVRWLLRIAGERNLTALAVQAAIILADHYDEEKGCAWPSQERLSTLLNASRAGVRQAIKRLEETRYVEYIPEKGRTKTNRYFLRFPDTENGY